MELEAADRKVVGPKRITFSRLFRWVLISLTVVVVLILLFVCWIGPVYLSISTKWKSPHVLRVVPVELKDNSISTAAGSKLRYFGYEFELPWNDLEDARKVHSNQYILKFHSGLQVSVMAVPPKEFVKTAADFFNVSRQEFEKKFGPNWTRSDFEFAKRVYSFAPQKMRLWSINPSVHYAEIIVLTIKSFALQPWAADSGIFFIGNQDFKGFQLGKPEAHPTGMIIDLYAEDGSVEFIFSQKDYGNGRGVSQPELNRVIQTLHRVDGNDARGY